MRCFTVGLLLLAATGPAAAIDIEVNSASGGRNVAGVCALRDAVAAVMSGSPQGGCPAGSGNDTITLRDTYTIVLTERDTTPGTNNAALQAVHPSVTLSIRGKGSSIVRSNSTPCNRDGVLQATEFRLIENSGDLTLSDLTLKSGCADSLNGAQGHGGAILNFGRLRLTRVTLRENNAYLFGGGLYSTPGVGVPLRIEASTFLGNAAASGGGVYANNGDTVISKSLFWLNQLLDTAGIPTPVGVAVASAGNLYMENSTVTGNLDLTVDGWAGAIEGLTSVTPGRSTALVYVTIANNTGSGVFNRNSGQFFTFTGSIVADNSHADCSGIANVETAHYSRNVFSDQSCIDDSTYDFHGVDPQLKAIGAYGGATYSRPPNIGSVAINGWSNCSINGGPLTLVDDQRDQPRPNGTHCDSGAVEVQIAPPADRIFAGGFE